MEPSLNEPSGGPADSADAHASTWYLNVQGVRLQVDAPTIVVRDALVEAGFDPNQGWHIFLKVAGQPKQAVELTTVIDLRTPGIEKLRLTPRHVTNGESGVKLRREFALLQKDEAFLDANYPFWETVVEQGRRWLIIPGFAVPPGYRCDCVTLAVEVPLTYPAAQVDSFHCEPSLILSGGGEPPNTTGRVQILQRSFQFWSRHRGAGSEWHQDRDSVVTHLALVEGALAAEVLQ